MTAGKMQAQDCQKFLELAGVDSSWAAGKDEEINVLNCMEMQGTVMNLQQGAWAELIRFVLREGCMFTEPVSWGAPCPEWQSGSGHCCLNGKAFKALGDSVADPVNGSSPEPIVLM